MVSGAWNPFAKVAACERGAVDIVIQSASFQMWRIEVGVRRMPSLTSYIRENDFSAL